ncbi:MAG: glycine--tRNA ligase subunit beta [Gammaproteobacteria bacterium]|nr:glycine--tRNA ligase subunit beta [Gammaproteobacteria bacterium]
MSAAADLLIEIGTEELPPKALKRLSECFASEIETRLKHANLTFSNVTPYATPRRLAVMITALERRQPDQVIERRGPAVNAAFKANGEPTPAATGFARSCNVAFEALERLKTDKGEWLVYRGQQAGRLTRELIPEIVAQALAALPIPKRMRWGVRTEEFVRPVHWVVLLHGTEIIAATLLGIASGNITRGHRFMGAASITLREAHEYVTRLRDEGRVIVDFAARRARVRELVLAAAAEIGGRPLLDDGLLDEVTALVEWPAPIVGTFERHFLDVPREALIATMQGNQKYFPLEDDAGRLLNRFITISNIESPHPEFIRDGNERVIRPRLGDAAFFYDKDRKIPLADRRDALGAIVFERRLGSLRDKSDRVAALAARFASDFMASADDATRAARLSRCDLVSEMVGEFPELQGTMGRYYALASGENAEVAHAVGAFYRPRFAGDAIPSTAVARCVALADRVDTLVGIFGIGGAPTGDKDPYALRRAALGVLRICIEGDVALDLLSALIIAAEQFTVPLAPGVAAQVFEFVMERARAYFMDRGVRYDIIDAVQATRPAPRALALRIAAVTEFVRLPQAAALAAANKRIANILKKHEEPLRELDSALLEEEAERILAEAVNDASTVGAALLAREDYTSYLSHLAGLHAPIDRFFDDVLVMAEDPALRANRVALLHRIQRMFQQVADIAMISA